MKTNHTPTPPFRYAKNDGSIWQGDELVAILYRENRKLDDAALIVKAINCHEELVESLKWALNRIRTAQLGEGDYFDNAEKAIAKAEGE